MVRKGQLSIDFYVSLLVFLGFVAYITFQLFRVIPITTNVLKEESIKIEAYQISEILINDVGHPSNWETKPFAEIKRIGLSDTVKNKANLLSSAKITRFNSICTNFNDIKNLLDIKDEASITIVEHLPTGDTVRECKSTQPTAKTMSFDVTRIVSIDEISFAEITVEVWKK